MTRKHTARPRVTLAGVAREAGVSVTTASLILANRDGWMEQFLPDTVRRVRAAAARLGYERNLFASGLPSGDSPFFALMLRRSDQGAADWSYWAFQGGLLDGVSAAAEARGLYAVVSRGDSAQASAIVCGGVLGSIFQSPARESESLIRAQMHRSRPTVVVFPEVVAEWPVNAIDMDNLSAGRLAGRLLARRQRARWGVVHYDRATEAHRLRIEGLREAADARGVEVSSLVLPIGVDELGAAELLSRQLQLGRYDALYAVDSVASIGAVLGCHKAGLSPGDECLVVGCDASRWRLPGFPRITSIDVSWQDVGVLALEQLLLVRRTGRNFRTMLLKPRLVPGETCATRKRPTRSDRGPRETVLSAGRLAV